MRPILALLFVVLGLVSGNPYDLISKRAQGRVSFKECNLDEGERLDCGFYGMGEEDCYKRGCCWGRTETEGVPWCYHSKPTLKPQCDVNDGTRLECGSFGMRKEQCLAQGCCWRPTNENHSPWCFHKEFKPVFEGQCGVPMVPPIVTGRIVGGQEAKEHSWPWMVSLQSGGHFCGGSLVNEQWIVTAAHCRAGFYGGATAVIGMHNKYDDAPNQRTVSIDEVIPYEGYNSETYDSDIMLLKLSEKIEFNDHVQPVCLPTQGEYVEVGIHCYSTGWGDLARFGESPDTLQQVMLPILSENTCNQPDWYDGQITDNMICAGYHEGGRDSCQGDSGGPLVCYINERWELSGVVSWGEGCAGEAKPGLYARVSNFVDWIGETINSNM